MNKEILQIVSPLEKIKLRGADKTGNGWYGASRGNRKHKGVDYLGQLGEPVYACITGVVRIGQVYANPVKSQFLLVEIKNELPQPNYYRVKQMYINPVVRTGDRVEVGDLIGHLQGIGDFYGWGMPNHCHVSIWKNGLLTDPEPIIKEKFVSLS